MLFYSTIHSVTLQLLKDLQNIELLKDFLLVGGTSLALQIGHRVSIDLDLFSTTKIDLEEVIRGIKHLGEIKIVNKSSVILNLYVGEIKVDFVSYDYDFLNPPILKDELRLASIEDIAAMKLSAITGRGSKKDFIDLYFLLQKFSLPKMFEFFQEKYPDGSDFLVYRSLTYFEDANIEPMPKMMEPISWDKVKNKIITEVKNHF